MPSSPGRVPFLDTDDRRPEKFLRVDLTATKQVGQAETVRALVVRTRAHPD